MKHQHSLANQKIVLLLGYLQLGGAEKQALTLAQGLKKSGAKSVEIWGYGSSGVVIEFASSLGIPTQILPSPNLDSTTSIARSVLLLSKKLRQHSITTILPFTTRPNVIAGLSWRLGGASQCWWNQRDEGRDLVPTLAMKTALRLSTGALSNAHFSLTVLHQKLKFKSQNSHVIRNGLSPSPPTIQRNEWRNILGIS
ncbi:MAG: hypothetical protein SFY68_07130, partial [Candidatus Sumerlaeia bacterium]|nr:hypothetical protein [Candidatus Sumerlaeia bacterium]